MKKLNLVICIVVCALYKNVGAQTNTFPVSGSVGVGTLVPHSSSIVEMQSTSQGMLVPRMTQGQRNAIIGPVTGLLIYQTNASPGFYYFNGASWTAVSSSAGANKTLSNLNATSINQSLNPNTDVLFDLGISSNRWRELNSENINTSTFHSKSFIQIGEYSDVPDLGMMRINGTSFEGYDGDAWVPFNDLGFALPYIDTAFALSPNAALSIVNMNTGVAIQATNSSTGNAVTGNAVSGSGVYGNSEIGNGINGNSIDGVGGYFSSDSGFALLTGTGKVGIGAVLPNSKLQVNSATGEDAFRVQINGLSKLYVNNNGGTSIGSSSTPPTNGLYVSGNVGIGINSPSVKLHINGSNELLRLTGTNPYMQFYSGTTTEIGYLRALSPDIKLATNVGNATGKLIFGNNGNEDLFVHPTGEVTVNTATPTTGFEFSVNGDGYFSSQIAVGTITADPTAQVTVSGTDDVLIIDGTDPFITWRDNDEDIGYMQALNEDLRIGIFSANTDGKIIFASDAITRMFIDHDGNIVMGGFSTTPKSGYKLSVDGKVVCEELRVEISPWADYVFDENYTLMSLSDLENYIQENNHLPNVPSASEIENNGLQVGAMQATMMEKIEELTLYVIELKKLNDILVEKIAVLENK